MRIGGQEIHFASSEDLSFLPRGVARLVVTSPPYWNLKDYGTPGEIGKEDYDQYLGRLATVWEQCREVAAPGAVMVVNVANRRHKGRFYPLAFDIARLPGGWTLWDVLIWYVPNALPQPSAYRELLFDNKHEYLLVFTRDGGTDYEFHKPRVPHKYADPRPDKTNPLGRCLGNVIRVPAYRPPNIREMGHHVAAYPEELVSLLIGTFTSPGDLVLDPFLGSGTTLKVAEAMGRRGVGVELNEGNSALIERRVLEPFKVPDWRDLDIIHSSTPLPTQRPRRRA